MPAWTYKGDDARVYPDSGLEVSPGCDDVEADTNPDDFRFVEASAPAPKKAPAK